MRSTPSDLRKRILFTAFILAIIQACYGQALTVSAGTTLTAQGGNFIIPGDIVNNGSFVNNNNTIVLSGTSRKIEGTGPVAFSKLTLLPESDFTMISPGHSVKEILLSHGTLNANGNLTLLSTAETTAIIDGGGVGQVNGNVTVQRYISRGFGYKILSSPVMAATVNELWDDLELSGGYPEIYRYDESRTSSGWVSFGFPTGTMSPMRGYLANIGSYDGPVTADITGVVNNGSVSLTLYNHNNAITKGFSLVGNPYPSPIDWNALSGWTKINIDNALYYFRADAYDQYGGTYVTYIDGISSDGKASNLIPSMQGFFIHVTDGTWPVTGTLAMNNSVRVKDLTHTLVKSGSEQRQLLRLTASFTDDSLSHDPIVIYFDEKATENFDGQLDALKLLNTDLKVPNLYTIGADGRTLSIDALPFILDTLYVVPLGLKTNRNGVISFGIRTIEGDLAEKGIYLFDKVTNKRYNLKDGANYLVPLDRGLYDNRFYINFTTTTTSVGDDPADPARFDIYESFGTLKLKIYDLADVTGTFTLTNITGQTLLVKKIHEPGSYEFSGSFREGIYFASFNTGTRKSVKKIYIRKQ